VTSNVCLDGQVEFGWKRLRKELSEAQD
jgi:hypothetical protein